MGEQTAALAEVRRLVAELQEVNFRTVEEFQNARAKLSSALQAAKQLGATEADLLEVGKAKTIEVDDASATGTLARRARKLRQFEKEQLKKQQLLEKERFEQERAARVA